MTIDPSTGVRGLEPGRQDLAYASQSCFQERQPHYRAAHFVYLPAIFRFTQPQHNKSDASGGSASRNLFGAAEVEFNRRARSIQTLGIQTLGATGHRCYGSTLIRIKRNKTDRRGSDVLPQLRY